MNNHSPRAKCYLITALVNIHHNHAVSQFTIYDVTACFRAGVELNPVNRVEFFCDYMDDFDTGVETL
jgi:hypothetical protein